MSCSREQADAIIALLNADPGTSSVYATLRADIPTPQTAICVGCQCEFTPRSFGRQYCDRACYDATLERKRDGRPPWRPPVRHAAPGTLGAGRALPADVAQYVIQRRGLPVPALIEDVQAKFGLRIGQTTVYRAWARAGAVIV